MTTDEQVRRSRAGVGVGSAGHLGVVSVGGADRIGFLHAQLPADIEALAGRDPHVGCRTAYLDRKGRVLFPLLLLPDPRGEEVLLLTERERVGALIETLETYHFGEDLAVADRSEDISVLTFSGPDTPLLFGEVVGRPVDTAAMRVTAMVLAGAGCSFLADPWSGDAGGWLLLPRTSLDRVLDRLEETACGPVPLVPEALEILRIEGGRPGWRSELANGVLLPEIDPSSEMVSYKKGCYIGQEVVARIHSRGHVNRVLAGLHIEGQTVPGPGTPVFAADEEVGTLTSSCWSPTLRGPVALAFLGTKAAAPDTSLRLGPAAAGVPAHAADLPLHEAPGPAARAEASYGEGMEHFIQDRYAEAAAAFERATRLVPSYADAWEALGVTCDRSGDLERAIKVMQTLVEIAPDDFMGWSNLSQYFGRQGRIEEAEAAQARAVRISMERQQADLGERGDSARGEGLLDDR